MLRPHSKGLLAPNGGARSVPGFFGLLGCFRRGGGADLGVPAAGDGFGAGRGMNDPNRSPQMGSSSSSEGDGGGDGLGMA
jgi:hypothetical protein